MMQVNSEMSQIWLCEEAEMKRSTDSSADFGPAAGAGLIGAQKTRVAFGPADRAFR